MLNFVDSYYKEFSVQISQFVDTFRVIPTISVNTGNFDVASQSFWLDYGENFSIECHPESLNFSPPSLGLNIQEIYFRNGILRKKEFEDIIRWTQNLRVLKIESNSLFRTWDIKGNYHERIHSFESCYHLSLSRNAFLNRKIFDYMVSKAPNLRELDLSFCMGKLSPTERNQLLDHLVFYLKGYGSSIKLLNLRQTLIDDFFLQQLSEVSKLKLKSLAITFNGSTNNNKFGIVPLVQSQTELESLDLQDSPAVEETLMMEISKHLKKLRSLNLKKCSHVTDYCIREISKLEHLEVLTLTSCELVTDEGIHDGLFCGSPKKKLRELNFGLLSNLTENLFARLGTKLHNQLTKLDLGGSTNLADDALQTIFWHFPYILHLDLDSLCKITDYGMTGKFQNQCYFSIKNLQGLRSLRMQNCYRVTDFSLIDSFEFKELREVYMARTHFGREGIEAMVKKCPAIEILDLGEVEGVDDDVVETITRYLKRLQTLKLNGKLKCDAIFLDLMINIINRKPENYKRVVRSHLQQLQRH